jgi:hypothetical protein
VSILDDIESLVEGASLTIYTGYAPTGATLPYAVQRPLYVDDVEQALSGDAVDWDMQISLYACAGSVEASFNFAMQLMTLLQGARAGGTTLSTSMGYSGAPVEGHYESQVTVQLNQGVLS